MRVLASYLPKPHPIAIASYMHACYFIFLTFIRWASISSVLDKMDSFDLIVFLMESRFQRCDFICIRCCSSLLFHLDST